MKSILILVLLPLCLGCTNKTIHQNSTNSEQAKPGFVKGGALTGGRSRENLMKGIMGNIGRVRQLYNEEFKDKYPDYMKVVVFFKINYLGVVTSSKITESNSNSPGFDSKILVIINSINFDQIEKRDDVTEVTYPFVFTK
ncbi:MAG TPA: AgmX/PglI C-terminal domain-containing protein [Chitinivibrionales bacterium]|nr:AgmX/PglI C-terminal domain-containing protein [Chitinivibrionales bacterium]